MRYALRRFSRLVTKTASSVLFGGAAAIWLSARNERGPPRLPGDARRIAGVGCNTSHSRCNMGEEESVLQGRALRQSDPPWRPPRGTSVISRKVAERFA